MLNGEYPKEMSEMLQKQVTLLQEVKLHLEKMPNNLSSISKEMHEMNRTLKIFADPKEGYVAIIAGKKQVPFAIFSMTTLALLLALLMAIMKLTNTEMHYKDLHIEPRGTNAEGIYNKTTTAK